MPPTFEEFAAQRCDALLRYATALTCDPHLAQDVVQDVLIRAHARWSRIGSTEQPMAYLKRMILNEYLSWRRRRANRAVTLSHPVLTAHADRSPGDDPTSNYAEREAMLDRIGRLPRKQRAVIVLRYYENLTDAEIADMLGCATATVRSHASHALATLRGPATPTSTAQGLNHAV